MESVSIHDFTYYNRVCKRNTIPEENRFVVEFVFAANNDLYKVEDYKYNR